MHSQQNNITTLKSQYIKLIHIFHMVISSLETSHYTNVQEVRKPNLNTFQRISDIVGIKYPLLGGLDTPHYTLQKLGNLISDTP